jgi:hypothetical protein
MPRANNAPSTFSHYVIGFYRVSHGKILLVDFTLLYNSFALKSIASRKKSQKI